jgi:hypothetical protein
MKKEPGIGGGGIGGGGMKKEPGSGGGGIGGGGMKKETGSGGVGIGGIGGGGIGGGGIGGSNDGPAWCGGMKKEPGSGEATKKERDFGGLRDHLQMRVGGGGVYFTTTAQMESKHNTNTANTIDLTSEADGGVCLAAGEAEEAAKAVADVKAAVGAEEAAELAKSVEDIEAEEAAQAVAMVTEIEDLDLAEEAEMEATRMKYRQLRVEIRQRGVRVGVIDLDEALDDTHVPSLTQEEQDAIDM